MSVLNRREALLAAGAAGVGAVLGVRGLPSPRAATAASCLLRGIMGARTTSTSTSSAATSRAVARGRR